MKKIKEYLEILKKERLVEAYSLQEKEECLIRHMTYTSKDAKEDTLFLCKGVAFKKEYLEEALKKGTILYVSEEHYEVGEDVSYIIVKNMRTSMAVLAKAFYEKADEELFLTGITGTKGKTTTAYYLRAILDAYLKDQERAPSGLISTIETCDGVNREDSTLTTPESLELFHHFHNAAAHGVRYMTMEVSSQALKYQRVRNIIFAVGVFLNIAEDHISPTEHEDFEDYFSAKLSLFKQTKTACVNLNADHADRILGAARMAERVLTFGTKGNPDILGRNIRMRNGKLSFDVVCSSFSRRFCLAMHGIFNVENALAAITAAYAMGIPVEYMEAGLAETKVPGRMEEYESRDGQLKVIVDFAHNRLSFEKLYESVWMEYPDSNIVTIFGCPGGKAFNRRKELGLTAGLFSQKVYLTADDPGSESPAAIAREIGEYLEVVGCPYEYVEDRGQAIRKAIREREGKTVLLVLGKGHEARQKYGKIFYRYPADAELVKLELRAYDRVVYSHRQGLQVV